MQYVFVKLQKEDMYVYVITIFFTVARKENMFLMKSEKSLK